MSAARRLALAILLCTVIAAGAGAAPQTLPVDSYPIDITYEKKNERVAKRVADIIEDTLPELLAEIGLGDAQPMHVDVVDDMSPYYRAFQGNIPVWGVAFALLNEQVIVVDAPRASNAWNSLETVIPHELSHLLLAQRVGTVRFPIWFLEGMAQWQAHEWTLVDSWQLMNAVWSGTAPPLGRLLNAYPVGEDVARAAYRVSYVAFTDLFDGRYEDLPAFLDMAAQSGSFVTSFEQFFGVGFEAYMYAFDDELERRYHSRLLIFQTGPLLSIAAVLFLLVILRHQLRKRHRMKEMERLERGMGGFPGDGT